MVLSVFYTVDTWIVALLLFGVMVIMEILGRWLAKRRKGEFGKNPANAAVITSLYGLMGLQVAFTFGMSAERFNARKHVIVDESNCIGTAIYRIDLYADSVRPAFRENFRQYLEARIRYYEAKRDTVKIQNELRTATHYGRELFAIAALHSRNRENLIASSQMIPALNAMFDVANTRFWGEADRTPVSIMEMLFFLAVSTAFMIGYTSADAGTLDWIRAVFFCFITSLVLYFIIDLDRPRSGLIQLDANQRAITDLRSLLN